MLELALVLVLLLHRGITKHLYIRMYVELLGQKTTLHDAEMKKKMIPSVVFEVADYKVCSVRFL
jgi:hypothetical protein